MPVVAVVNRKGGSGKSTLATHIAAYWVHAGLRVMLGDVDKQQSIRTWLKQRSPALPEIMGWVVDERSVLRPPNGVTHVVLDTPGGLRGLDLARVVMFADAIVLPVAGSIFDRDSAADCWQELRRLPRIVNGNCKVVCMGMRIDPNTHQEATTRDWAVTNEIPFLGSIRENAKYVQWVDSGETLFDQKDGALSPERAQWAPLLQWMATNMNGAILPSAGAVSSNITGSVTLPVAGTAAAPAFSAPPLKSAHLNMQTASGQDTSRQISGRVAAHSLAPATTQRLNTHHFSSQVLADHRNNPVQAVGVENSEGGVAYRPASSLTHSGASTSSGTGIEPVPGAATVSHTTQAVLAAQASPVSPSNVPATMHAPTGLPTQANDASSPTPVPSSDSGQGTAKSGFKFLSIPDFLRRK